MFCSYCGTKVEEGGKFCPNCGSPVAEAPVEVQPTPVSVQQPVAPVQQPVVPAPIPVQPVQQMAPPPPVVVPIQQSVQQPAFVPQKPVYDGTIKKSGAPALIFGLLGLLCSQLAIPMMFFRFGFSTTASDSVLIALFIAVFGIIFSSVALGQARRSAWVNGIYTGPAKAGKVLGIIGLVFSIISTVVTGVFVMIAIFTGALFREGYNAFNQLSKYF